MSTDPLAMCCVYPSNLFIEILINDITNFTGSPLAVVYILQICSLKS